MITKFKLFEAGEWSNYIDWQYTKDNPDDDSDESIWIRSFEKTLNTLISKLNDKSIFIINDIRGFDMYQGPYAIVTIFGKKYKICEINDDDPLPSLWIDNFPIDNTSEDDKLPGYQGSEYSIARLLNDIDKLGGIDLYLAQNKYNL